MKSEGKGLLVLPSRGDGTFDAAETIAASSEYLPSVLPMRLDVDAHADLVLNAGGDILLIDGATRTVQTAAAERRVLAVADFNRDGLDDLVVRTRGFPGALGVWLSRP